MIAETKRRVSQLLEINRALTHDLDVSHRNAAQLARERDALKQSNEELRGELEVLLLDCEAARARAYRAEERSRSLAERLREVEQERDDALAQLDESTVAMEEIRCRLHASLDGSLPWLAG